MGIAADKICSVFLEQESDQSGDNWDGTGLGLPICLKLVHEIGGRIYYNSNKVSCKAIGNNSTTFMLVIPKVDTANTANEVSDHVSES
mmetsp:Transcript_1500/g.1280  ORF Transcript_1500/g.1280 Transcript_1500/m.1280 type:complete len:88 (-) Transcript_1500:711-974(-)